MNERLTPYLTARWPGYAERIVAGMLVAAGLMLGAAWRGQWWLLPLGAAVVLVVVWFYAASTWQMRNWLGGSGSAEKIWRLLKLDPFARYICIETGTRATSLQLSHRLQRGALKVVDVFNPQLMPDPALARLRTVAQAQVAHEPADPRAIWVEGRIGQLPQRDESVPAIVIDRVLSELAQAGDRERLLREAFRILEPGGKLVVIESVSRGSNRWTLGSWVSAEAVQSLITDRRFTYSNSQPLNGLLEAFVAVKPIPQATQLHFNF